jgi:hypothetical protein
MKSAIRFTIVQAGKFPFFAGIAMTVILILAVVLVVVIAVINSYSIFFPTNVSDMIEERLLFRSPIWMNTAFADHGREVSIELNSGTFMPLTSAEGNQVKLGVNYTTLNGTFIGNPINAVMKVYAPNTTAIKSTSFPNGFTANRSGTQEIKTTIGGNSTQNITAVVQFTDSTKTLPVSNPVQMRLNLTQGSSREATLVEEPEYEIAALPPP